MVYSTLNDPPQSRIPLSTDLPMRNPTDLPIEYPVAIIIIVLGIQDAVIVIVKVINVVPEIVRYKLY